MDGKETSVKVSLRVTLSIFAFGSFPVQVRPPNIEEKKGQAVVRVIGKDQVVLDKDQQRPFTFDCVFDEETSQVPVSRRRFHDLSLAVHRVQRMCGTTGELVS